MPCPILLQDTVGEVTFLLELSTDGSPATGLTFSDVTADLKKEGGSFAAFTLTVANFTEIGAGFYAIDLATTDTDTLGNMYLRISGATISTALVTAFVAATAPTNPTAPLSVPLTALFGYVTGADGAPLVGISVGARVLASPAVLHPSEEALVLGTSLVTVNTDSGGFFTISLVTGAEVDFFIPAANYRRTLRVPGTSQNVFSIA